MRELLRTKRITIAVIVFIFILIIGFLTAEKPVYTYRITPKEMLAELPLIYFLTPDEAMDLMYDSSTVFVDIRSIYDYDLGHLENAINIPIPELLLKENKPRFEKWKKDSVTVVLYGNDEREAVNPWMLLYELGYTNTCVLMGGYGYIDKLYSDELPENATYSVEDPAYDFAEIVKKAASGKGTAVSPEPEKKKVIIRKKKKKEAEGGC